MQQRFKVSILFVKRDFYHLIVSNIPFIHVTVVAERAINSKVLFETMHTPFFFFISFFWGGGVINLKVNNPSPTV